MSDSDESGITYTDISSPFEELSDIGSPRANDHEHLMLSEMLEDPYVEVALQAPPSPDYIHGPEEPEQAPPSPDYIPGPEYVNDEIIAEDQPDAEDASPIAQSPEYVPESDFEAHPEDNDDEDPEEDHVDYLADGGDDGDDEEESSEDDEDDDMDIKADEEEKEEHPALADSVVVAVIAADQAPIIPFPPLPLILSPPSPVLSPAPPPSPIRSLGYRAAMIRLRDEAASTSSPPLQLPSASHREDRPEVTLPPQKRLGIAFGPRYEYRVPSRNRQPEREDHSNSRGYKSYANLKRKPMEFQVGDKVILKVSPWKGVVRFGKRGKLNPRYVGPFKVLERVGDVAYKLDLPEELSKVHNMFHVSKLKKCHANEPLAVPLDGLHFDDKLHFVEEPVEIVYREVKHLKRSRIRLVKV
nr:putative reverse transcriptase domain-containing protein [Tanacetum cinerariifolium]